MKFRVGDIIQYGNMVYSRGKVLKPINPNRYTIKWDDLTQVADDHNIEFIERTCRLIERSISKSKLGKILYKR